MGEAGLGCAITWTLNCLKVGSAATGGNEMEQVSKWTSRQKWNENHESPVWDNVKMTSLWLPVCVMWQTVDLKPKHVKEFST